VRGAVASLFFWISGFGGDELMSVFVFDALRAEFLNSC
jgi:hypothetical protein